MARTYALEPLNFPQLNAVEMMRVADAAGYSSVSFTLADINSGGVDPLVLDEGACRDAAGWMRERRLSMQTIECFNLTPAFDLALAPPVLKCGETLGAHTLTTIMWGDFDPFDSLPAFRELCVMGAAHGIRTNVEFFPGSLCMRSLSMAVEFVERADHSNAGIAVDLLHLMRCGSSVEALRKIDPAMIRGAQVNDGPATILPEEIMIEAGVRRLDLGDGEFPVADFLEALPQGLVVGLEVPKGAIPGDVVPVERAAEILRKARSRFG